MFPHDLTEKNLMDRIPFATRFINVTRRHFLKQVMTGNEKWIIYNNVERKRSWGKRNEPPFSHPKSWSLSKEGHALCLVGLERDPVL